MDNFSTKNFCQNISPISLKNREIISVNVERYVLADYNQALALKSILGSCVGLIGYNDGIGFLVHIRFYTYIDAMIAQLRDDIKKRIGLKLEDFDLTISGGNSLSSFTKLDPGTKNIDTIKAILGKMNYSSIHLQQKVANVIQLSLETGKITSRPIKNFI